MKNTNNFELNQVIVLLGIDVHKLSWEVRFAIESVNKRRVRFEKPFVDNLVRYCNKHYPNSKFICAYEAGFSGFWAQRALANHGFEALVVNPCDIPTSGKDRVFKTDKRDSRKIVAALRSGELEGIHCPTQLQERDRSLLRTRSQIAKMERKCKNRIKSALLFFGIDIPEDLNNSRWSKRFIDWLGHIAEKEEHLSSLKHQLSTLKAVRIEHASVLKSLRKLSRNDRHRKICEYLETISGIGPLTSIKLKLELISMDRFSSTDKLLSYLGFVPTLNQSGESNRVGKMTKRGKSELRRSIIESAWVAIRHDPALASAYEELKKKKGANKAIVKIAVKLVRRIRYVWVNQTNYVKNIK